VEDVDHNEKGWTKTIGNWRKQYLRGEKVDQMRNEFWKWVDFRGLWQQMNKFETQGGIQVGWKCGN
jgi:hypothetical protein